LVEWNRWKKIKLDFVLEFVLYFGQFGIVKMMMWLLTKLECLNFCRLSMDPHVVLSPSIGPAEAYGFWLYSTDGGPSGYLHLRVSSNMLIGYKKHKLYLYDVL
jgi:hypothetical protein